MTITDNIIARCSQSLHSGTGAGDVFVSISNLKMCGKKVHADVGLYILLGHHNLQ